MRVRSAPSGWATGISAVRRAPRRAARLLCVGLVVATAANGFTMASAKSQHAAHDLAPSVVQGTGSATDPATSDTVVRTASDVVTVHGNYVPVEPARVYDSRRPESGAALLAAGSTVTVPFAGVAGVPAQGVTAVVVNVTATGTAGSGYVTLWPSGSTQPTASALNIERAGQTIPNLVTVPVGPDGSISVFTSAATHIIIDLQGYYHQVDTASDGRLTVITPQRLLDTRSANAVHTGALVAGEAIDLDVSALAGIPTDAVAAVLNVTVANSTAAGFWTLWPTGGTRPDASNLNVERAGQTIPNQVLGRLAGGHLSVFSQSGGDLVVDITGWFTGASAAATTEGLFVPVTPTRVLDTRSPSLSPLGGAKPKADTIVNVSLAPLGVPTTQIAAVAFNATLTQASSAGFVTASAAGLSRSTASSLNATRAGQTIANHVTVAVTTAGLALYTQTGGHLIVDVAGYYVGTPTAVPPPPDPGIGGGGGGGTVPTGPGSQPTSPPSTGAHTFLYSTAYGTFARWNPCTSVTYKLNLTGAPSFARAAVADAVNKVMAATGINLVDLGDTTAGLTGTPPAGVDAVIAFSASQADGTPFGGGTLGQGGGSYSYSGAGLNAKVVSGYVLVNRSYSFLDGYVANGLSQTLLHELGHMVGLGHVNDGGEVMYAYSHTVTGWGPGDREGLWNLGAAQSCLP